MFNDSARMADKEVFVSNELVTFALRYQSDVEDISPSNAIAAMPQLLYDDFRWRLDFHLSAENRPDFESRKGQVGARISEPIVRKSMGISLCM